MKIKSHRKSQITLIMIVGLILFIIVGFTLYVSKSYIKRQGQQGVKKTQGTAIDINPIKNFISECQNGLAKDSVALIGKQGGYLYKSQNGQIVDYKTTDEGKFYIKFNGIFVTYNILSPKFSIQNFFSATPPYPWSTFPYIDDASNEQTYKGFFGIGILPPLNYSDGPNSMQSQMENYIDNNIKECANFSAFENQGFKFNAGIPKTSVVIGNEDMSAHTTFPVTVTNSLTNEKFDISEFSTKVNVRLKDIYYFVKGLVRNDIGDINFSIRDPKNDKDSINVQVVENALSYDDIIIVSDQKSAINGNQYKYVFARKNRAPALHYIKNNELSFEEGHEITQDDLLGLEELKASDPDEDKLAFSIKAMSGNPNLPRTLDSADSPLKFKIEVTDGKLSDYQIITVNVI